MQKIDLRRDHNPKLTDEERAAIAAYTGRVRKIPTGETRADLKYRWCEKSNNLRLVGPNGKFLDRNETLRTMKGNFKKKRANSGTHAGHAKQASIGTINREKVRQAVEDGWHTHADLMAVTGLSTSTVSVHLKALGINLLKLKGAKK